MDELEWSSPEFVARYGIHRGNLLEYLSLSPFWERGTTNQTLQQQRQLPWIPHSTDELRQMQGKEYVVVSDSVVMLVEREGPDTTRPLATLFLVGAKVYMAPKLSSCLRHLSLEMANHLAALPTSFSETK